VQKVNREIPLTILAQFRQLGDDYSKILTLIKMPDQYHFWNPKTVFDCPPACTKLSLEQQFVLGRFIELFGNS
jgi:hypothetical protein